MTKHHDWKDTLWALGMAAILFVIAGIALVIAAKFEADAFNRLTGGNATTWDAMWTELRVQGEQKS